ncbi:MAG: ABC transporter permease [Clostridia bacterium]|nr:ABC transporter permease [Clostridia bacterium]
MNKAILPCRKYLSYFRMRFIGGLQYRAAAAAGISTQFAWGFLNILLFKALYETNPAVFPMDFQALSAYIWLRQAFLAMMNSWTYDNELLDTISSGSIAYELARPVDLYWFWMARTMSTRVSRAALRCMPILLVAAFLPVPYGLTLPPTPVQAVFFLLTLVLACYCVCAFTMLVYISCFHTIHSQGIRMAAGTLADFLSGGYLPVLFMPQALRTFVEYSPFGAMENLPFRIYSGSIAGAEMIRFVLLQILWCVILTVIGKLWMSASLRHTVSQGG